MEAKEEGQDEKDKAGGVEVEKREEKSVEEEAEGAGVILRPGHIGNVSRMHAVTTGQAEYTKRNN